MSPANFTPIEGKPGWSRAVVPGDCFAIEELAKTLDTERRDNIYFVCGLLPNDEQHFLYRVETHDPLEIVRAFEVGDRPGVPTARIRIRR